MDLCYDTILSLCMQIATHSLQNRNSEEHSTDVTPTTLPSVEGREEQDGRVGVLDLENHLDHRDFLP